MRSPLVFVRVPESVSSSPAIIFVYKENKGLKEALLATLTPYLNSEITAEEAAEKIMDYTPSTALK